MPSNPQSEVALCPKCSRPLPAQAPEGICPVCLFARMLAAEPGEITAEFAPGTSPLAGTRTLGDYELLDEVARGGMGVVYRARHRRLNRVVALKMVSAAHLAGETAARRFRLEAEAAASLDHPNIVPIYEVGEADGRLFYTMKLAEGGPLSRQIEQLQLRPGAASNGHARQELQRRRERLIRLVIQIAHAVHHAHERGLLHRDLKPSNILLDAAGEPAVTDFGLARWIEEENDLTVSGTVVGSPSYMSPEQAAGRAPELTTAADVYGLGAVLFYLLTGRAPFAEESALATMRAVVERDAPRPSALNAAVDLDLDTICRKCLEKVPARRYQSARALAEDLERTLRGEPIHARPASWSEQAGKWARRNPALALLSLVLLLAPVVIITLLAKGNARVNQAQQATRLHLYAADMQVAQTALEDANLALARQILENYQPRAGELDLRGFEWRYLWQRAQSGQLRVLRQHAQPVNALQFSPDGNWLATSELGRTVWFWSTTTWKPERVIDWSGESQEPFRRVSFSHDGTRFVITMDGAYCPIFEAATWHSDYSVFAAGTEWTSLPHVEWSPRSDKLAFLAITGPGQRACGVVDWAEFLRQPGPRLTNRIAGFVVETRFATTPAGYPNAPIRWLPGVDRLHGFSPDGRLLTSRGGRLISHDVEGQAAAYDFASPHFFDYCAVAPNGKFLAGFNSQPKDRHSVLMDEFLPHYTNCWEMIGHEGEIRALAISPDSRKILSGSADHTARVWDAASRKTIATLRGHADEVTAVAWSPDGKLIATGSRDRSVRLWATEGTQGADEWAAPLTGLFGPWSLTADGAAIIGRTAAAAGEVAVATVSGKSRWTIASPTLVQVVHANSPGALLAVHRDSGGEFELRQWNATTQSNSLVRTLPLPGPKSANLSAPVWAASPSGLWLARSGEQGTVDVWSLEHPTAPARILPGEGKSVKHLEFSPGDRSLAVSYAAPNQPTAVRLWRLDNLGGSALTVAAIEGLNVMAWSPDGNRLALAGDDRAIRLYQVADGRFLASLAGHKRAPESVTFAPDGRTLASADPRTIKLWHVASGREMLTLHRDPKVGAAVEWLRFAPAGNYLLAGDAAGLVQVFSAD
jgi:WD40 repeat protein